MSYVPMSELDRVESSRCSWPVMSLPMCGRVALQALILKIEPGLGWRWIDSDCIYVYAVPGKTHRMVQWSVFNTLCNAMRASGISIAQAEVIWNQPGDYSTPNGIRVLTSDIVIEDRGQTIAVVEIEITHRTIPVLRSHAQNNLPW